MQGEVNNLKPEKINWENKVTLIKPCLEDNGLVMGEIFLNSRKISSKTEKILNMNKLCQIFKKINHIFHNIKPSEKLGLVTFTFSNKEVIITEFGRLTIRKAQNKDDLLSAFAYLIDLLIKHNLLRNTEE